MRQGQAVVTTVQLKPTDTTDRWVLLSMTGSFHALRAKIQLYGRQRTQTPVGLQSICHIPELQFKKK
jgi:hypothetical protein